MEWNAVMQNFKRLQRWVEEGELKGWFLRMMQCERIFFIKLNKKCLKKNLNKFTKFHLQLAEDAEASIKLQRMKIHALDSNLFNHVLLSSP